MANVIIAKNLTTGDLPLIQLSIPDGLIPGSGQVTLTNWNSVHEIMDDPELLTYVNNNEVILNLNGSDLDKENSLVWMDGGIVSLSTPPTGGNEGDRFYSTDLGMELVLHGGRWVSTETATYCGGRCGNIRNSVYLRGAGNLVMSANQGYEMPFDGLVVAIGWSRTNTSPSVIEVCADGSPIASASVEASKFFGSTKGLGGLFTANQILGIRNSPSGNKIKNAQVHAIVRWRIP